MKKTYEWIDAYILSKTGITKDFKEEWEWERYLLNQKMIAAICNDKDGNDIITVKCEPSFGEQLRNEYEEIGPGHYIGIQ